MKYISFTLKNLQVAWKSHIINKKKKIYIKDKTYQKSANALKIYKYISVKREVERFLFVLYDLGLIFHLRSYSFKSTARHIFHMQIVHHLLENSIIYMLVLHNMFDFSQISLAHSFHIRTAETHTLLSQKKKIIIFQNIVAVFLSGYFLHINNLKTKNKIVLFVIR